MEILRCEKVRKVYGSGSNQVTALDGIDLSVNRGEFAAILGASGSGKSTLLHILGSVDKPDSGKVIIDGTDLAGLNQTQAAIFRRRKVGLVYQFYNLIPTLTVRKNILMPLTLDRKKPNKEYFDNITDSLGITDKLDVLPNQLSGGQQQRAASFSLIIIIHNSFAVSMNARIHQFGIFSSIGATPKQIRTCLLQEAAVLCAGPVLAGNLLGISGSAGIIHLTNIIPGSDVPGRHKAAFGCHPLVVTLTLIVTIITVWISAWLPARKLSRLTPLEAIKNTGELQLKRKKSSRILSLLFGVEGELAGSALKTQKKALRTASLSFIFSFLAFAVMQCFFSLSGISTRETYFERYQDVWDIMITVKDTDADNFEEIAAVRKLDGIKSAIVYQKASAKRVIAEEEMSDDMKSFGGFTEAPANDVSQADGGWLVNAPIIIMDDQSFSAYCEQIGVTPQLDGAVILNQIRDVTNPDFRHPVFMPYIKGESTVSVLRQSGNEEMTAEVPVLSYTQEVPLLREEYAKLDYYELVHFIPVSLWKEIRGQIGGMEEDSCICVRGRDDAALEELNVIQDEIAGLVQGKYTIEQENRIQKYETNSQQIQGMMTIFGGFCILLAMIGIGNVFSNTLGFVRQRRREFARYMSIGMTPEGLRKMFCTEAVVIAGRPILISLPLAVITIGFLLRTSYMEVGTFLDEAPLLPIFLFMLAVSGSVALAYCLAWRNIRKINRPRCSETIR